MWQPLTSALNQADRLRQERAANLLMLWLDSPSFKLAPRIFEERGIEGGRRFNRRKRQIAADGYGAPT
jgi:hypothetical protein